MCLVKANNEQLYSSERTVPSSPQHVISMGKQCSMKKISFNESVAIRRIDERSSEMSPQVKLQAYYSSDELQAFELEVIQVRARIIRQARALSSSNPALSPAEYVSSILSNEIFRGFEVRLCPDRNRSKAMVLNAVHKCQKELKSLESSLTAQYRELILAKAYSELSKGARKLAIDVGKSDELQANQQHGADLTTGPSGTQNVSIAKVVTLVPDVNVKREIEIGNGAPVGPRKRPRLAPNVA